MIRLWPLLTAVLFALPAWADPPAPLRADAPDLDLVGKGQLRWWGFRVYEASLWAPDGDYRPGTTPYALEIRYQRDFSAEEIIDTTADELERLEYPTEQITRWTAELHGIFPDIRQGDRLIGLNRPDGPTLFYSSEASLGSVADPAFGPAFFAIWLDPRARQDALRHQLLGKRP